MTSPPLSPVGTGARPWRLLLAACVGLAALSLLGPRSPMYDPWAWLTWGRQLAHLDLHTVGGPSWKPLPVVFTTAFSAIGSGPAPLLWLVVARAGGLLATALAFRLAARIAGPAAGIIAAFALLLSAPFLVNVGPGDSEGLLVALVLWAVERHLDGRRRDAFLLGVAAALLRPEVWPFVALSGLWLIRAGWRGSPPWRTILLVAGAGAGVAVLWFVPEYLGSGNVLRAASRAREPVADSPAQADHPFLAVFANSASALAWPAYAGAVLAVLVAARAYRRDRGANAAPVLGLAAIATALMVIVAVLAMIGFTGNLRYVTLPAAIVCVLGGVGWAWLVGATRRRHGTAAAAALATVLLAASAPFVVSSASARAGDLRQLRADDRLMRQLPELIDQAGGRAAVLACGPIVTGPFETQLVAWSLNLRQDQVLLRSEPPATMIVVSRPRLALDPRFTERARTSRWILASSCARP